MLVEHLSLTLRNYFFPFFLQETAIKLRDGLRLNYTSLRDAINFLMDETTQAESFLNNQGPELVQNVSRRLTRDKILTDVYSVEFFDLLYIVAKKNHFEI